MKKYTLKNYQTFAQLVQATRLSFSLLKTVKSMFPLAFLISIAFLNKVCATSLVNTTTEKYTEIVRLLNVTQLNFNNLDALLNRLHLGNCPTRNGQKLPCGKNCLSASYLSKLYGSGTNAVIDFSQLPQLSTILLFSLLPEKNAGLEICQNGDFATKAYYVRFLQYYQTTGRVCARLLDKILRDINETFKDTVTKRCFSADDLFSAVDLSIKHDELDAEQFSVVSIVIISHLIKGHCILPLFTDHDLKLPCKSFFTSNLVNKFGINGTIPVEGFEEILEVLGLGELDKENDLDDHNHGLNHVHNHRKRRDTNSLSSLNTSYPEQCYSSHELLDIFSIDESVGFSLSSFKEICPAIVNQLESKSCEGPKEKIEEHHSFDKYVWLYGFVSVLIISLLSLAGIAVIPSMKGLAYKKIIIVLVGLAIGTLAGDALLHLIPHAAGFHSGSHGHDHEHGDESKAFIWKFLVVASGVYGFFLFETLTHLFLRTGHGHSHSIEHTRKHSPFERNNSCRTMERHEMRLATGPISETVISDTPQVIYNKGTRNTDEKAPNLNSDEHHDDNLPNLLTVSPHGQDRKISSVGWMIIIGDTIHNITDGIAIGAAFSEDVGGGISTSIAVFCHELPHELGDFAVLTSAGMTVKQAMLANFLSACSSFIGLVIGILIGQETEQGNQWVFAVMGGMFLYVALVDMLPELMHSEELGDAGKFQIFFLQNVGILTGFLVMSCIAYFEEDLVIPL